MLNDLESIKAEGFQGFITVRQLRASGLQTVPTKPGVYLVLRTTADVQTFLEKSTGGWFKEEDPTVTFDELHKNWVNGAVVLNIGKAGGPGNAATLKSRLKQYLDFGSGRPIGHRGGRLIWQLTDADDLVIAWKTIEPGLPREVEAEYIRVFKEANQGRRPFANLQD